MYYSEQESEGTKAETKKKGVQDTIRTFGELTLDDLPPVPDVSTLNVEVPEHECVHIGNVSGIIDRLGKLHLLRNYFCFNKYFGSSYGRIPSEYPGVRFGNPIIFG